MIYTVKSGDTLFGIARKFELSVQSLKDANGLTSNILMVGQQLKIPNAEATNENGNTDSGGFFYTVKSGDTLFALAERFNTSVTAIKLLNGLSSNSLSLGQQLLIPGGSSSTSGGGVDGPVWEGATFVYDVEPGDTLSRIAQKFDTTISRIKSLNGLHSDMLSIGQRLKIPGTRPDDITPFPPDDEQPTNGGVSIYTVKAGDTLSSIARKYGTTVADIKRINVLVSDNLFIGQQLKIEGEATDGGGDVPPIPDIAKTYTVRSGDSLWKISQLFNISVDEIKRLNNLASDSLSVGQVLIVGGSSSDDSHGGGSNDGGGGSDGNLGPVGLPTLRFKYDFEISGSVGEHGLNQVNDLKKVQKKLLEIGLLDALPYRTESPDDNDTGNVNPVRIIQTINAIKEFQRNYVRLKENEINGTIKPQSISLMLLNSTPLPDKVDLAAAKAALRKVTVAVTDGSELRGAGISGPVGATNWGNKPADVRKIQNRLREMKYFVPQSEEPSGMSAISQHLIPRTIAALQRFQKIVEFFLNSRAEILGSPKTYIRRLVAPTDFTMELLQKYKQYELVMAHPQNASNSLKVKLNNYVPYHATVDVEGVSYTGEVSPYDVPISTYQSLGLTPSQAKALRYVSGHEGKFDAINTYDMAILSYGFIQFAGNDKGSLGAFLATAKMNYPHAFEKRFAKYGLDVEYAIVNGKIKKAQLVLNKPDGGGVLHGPDAERHIKDNLQYIGALIMAAYDPNIQKAQIETAAREYVFPALNHKLNFDVWVGGSKVSFVNTPFSQIIRSEMGVTALIDITVNQWVDNAEEYFVHALKTMAKRENLNTKSKLLAANEKKLLREIVKYTQNIGQHPISGRVADIAGASGLSAWKA